jgi:ankyrin repeat protein
MNSEMSTAAKTCYHPHNPAKTFTGKKLPATRVFAERTQQVVDNKAPLSKNTPKNTPNPHLFTPFSPFFTPVSTSHLGPLIPFPPARSQKRRTPAARHDRIQVIPPMKTTLVAAFLTSALAGPLLAADTIDFAHDVQPLIQKHCIACHGPEQQMNAFRLDRRSAALRGGTRSVIVPGNSAASRLYLRLLGDQFGRRMPASGALSPDEIGVFKAWIDQGAPWPDSLANEPILTPPDPRAVHLTELLRTGDLAAFRKAVAADPKTLNLRGPAGSTPFMLSVIYADAASISDFLDKGADPNRRNDAGATALMWAVVDPDKTRALVTHGADVNALSADGRTPLVIASARAGSAPVVQFLLEHGADPNPKGRAPGDASPLREAAAAGDPDTMALLIAHHADLHTAGAGALSGALESRCQKCLSLIASDVDEKSATKALLTLAVASDPDAIRYVLDHGANVNAADVDGRTALMYAANNDRLPLATVGLLLEHKADVNAKAVDGMTALDSAWLHSLSGKPSPIVELLIAAGAKGQPPVAPNLTFRRNNTIPAAVQLALPPLQRADLNFTRKSGCVSCHNEALTDMAISTARRSGFHIDEPMAKQEVAAVASFFGEWRERLLQGMAPGGPAYILQGLHAEHYPADLTTDAIARYIKGHQLSDGHWGVGCGGSRNPLCGDEVTNTANSLRALQFYAPAPLRTDFDRSVQRAAAWLAKAPVFTHEDRTFRVFGLAWAASDKPALDQAVRELLAEQCADGGWADNPFMPTTAYATGQALIALNDAGIAVSDPVWQKGIDFLLRTQTDDGSWYVRSHSYAAQPYFDDGFPHGVDQWISASATNWAVIALSRAARPGASFHSDTKSAAALLPLP